MYHEFSEAGKQHSPDPSIRLLDVYHRKFRLKQFMPTRVIVEGCPDYTYKIIMIDINPALKHRQPFIESFDGLTLPNMLLKLAQEMGGDWEQVDSDE